MSTYATFYLSRAQKFEVQSKTDPEREEVKLEIKTVFDNLTIGVSKDQAKLVRDALTKEIGDGGPKDDVPF